MTSPRPLTLVLRDTSIVSATQPLPPPCFVHVSCSGMPHRIVSHRYASLHAMSYRIMLCRAVSCPPVAISVPAVAQARKGGFSTRSNSPGKRRCRRQGRGLRANHHPGVTGGRRGEDRQAIEGEEGDGQTTFDLGAGARIRSKSEVVPPRDPYISASFLSEELVLPMFLCFRSARGAGAEGASQRQKPGVRVLWVRGKKRRPPGDRVHRQVGGRQGFRRK